MKLIAIGELEMVCGGSWTGYSAGNSFVSGIGNAAGAAYNAGAALGNFVSGFAAGFYASF